MTLSPADRDTMRERVTGDNEPGLRVTTDYEELLARDVLVLLDEVEAAEADTARLLELISDFTDHIEDIGRPGHLARQDALLDRIQAVLAADSGVSAHTQEDET